MKPRLSILFLSIALLLFSCVKEESPENKTDNTGIPANDSAYHLDAATLLQLVNTARESGCTCGTTAMPPVPAISWNNTLANAADNHSLDMELNAFFSHSGSDGSTAGDRITAAGYAWHAYGENIATGYADEQAVMQAWLHSEAHCKNIMGANFKEMGAAREGSYWTQDFGSK